MIATTYTIEFSTPGVDPWFRRTNQFESYRRTLGIQGSHYLATDVDQDVYVIDVDSGQLLYTLKVPLIHNDPTLRLPVQLSSSSKQSPCTNNGFSAGTTMSRL